MFNLYKMVEIFVETYWRVSVEIFDLKVSELLGLDIKTITRGLILVDIGRPLRSLFR